jgi:hypothetical protein
MVKDAKVKRKEKKWQMMGRKEKETKKKEEKGIHGELKY